jgi:hypothetical protein
MRDVNNIIPEASADNYGKLFVVSGHLYRGFTHDESPFAHAILESTAFSAFVQAGLIPTKIVDLPGQPFELVVEHKLIPFVAYPMEWTAKQFLRAAKMVVTLDSVLRGNGFCLKDPHPWNVVFESGGTPRYVDFGSIVSVDSAEAVHAQSIFCRTFIWPLILYYRHYQHLARGCLLGLMHGVSERLIMRLLFSHVCPGLILKTARLHKTVNNSLSYKAGLQIFSHYLDHFPQTAVKTAWTEYRSLRSKFSLSSPGEWDHRLQAVHDHLKRENPKTVLELGANDGFFSEMAAQLGARVIALELDEKNLDRLNSHAETSQLEMYSARVDLQLLTPAHGLNTAYPALVERAMSDCILAMAVMHHVVLRGAHSVSSFVKMIADLSLCSAVIEFIPSSDSHVSQWDCIIPSNYDLVKVSEECERYFSEVRVVPSMPDPRVIIICSGRK